MKKILDKREKWYYDINAQFFKKFLYKEMED